MSCTIIVTDANALTRPIHDRMPVALDKADIRRWLKGEVGARLLKPAALAVSINITHIIPSSTW